MARICRPVLAAPVRKLRPSTSFAAVSCALEKNRPARSSPPRSPPNRPTGQARGQAPPHRLARDHPSEDRSPPYSRRRSPNDPSDHSISAPVLRLPSRTESYSLRVAQAVFWATRYAALRLHQKRLAARSRCANRVAPAPGTHDFAAGHSEYRTPGALTGDRTEDAIGAPAIGRLATTGTNPNHSLVLPRNTLLRHWLAIHYFHPRRIWANHRHESHREMDR
jgi:hypothetical protein